MRVTYLFIGIAILVLIVLLFRSENKFQFAKAGVLFVFQLTFSTVNFLIFFFIAYLLMNDRKEVYLGNLFSLLAIFVILSGIFLVAGKSVLKSLYSYNKKTVCL